jgi:ABC-2 type transport system ATP-binding protein
MDEAERCVELLMIREGSIVAQGEPDELRRRTGSDDLEEAFLVLVESE